MVEAQQPQVDDTDDESQPSLADIMVKLVAIAGPMDEANRADLIDSENSPVQARMLDDSQNSLVQATILEDSENLQDDTDTVESSQSRRAEVMAQIKSDFFRMLMPWMEGVVGNLLA